MMNSSDFQSHEFEFAADAWQWLDDNGFIQSSDHLKFSHPDGRVALLIAPKSEDPAESTEIKILL